MTAHAHTPHGAGPCTIKPAPYNDAAVRQLLAEFQAAQMALYGFAHDPSATPPDDYTAPNALFLLARTANREPAGCGGWRRLDEQTAEIKRMYLRPALRGLSLGRRIVHRPMRSLPWVSSGCRRWAGMTPAWSRPVHLLRRPETAHHRIHPLAYGHAAWTAWCYLAVDNQAPHDPSGALQGCCQSGRYRTISERLSS